MHKPRTLLKVVGRPDAPRRARERSAHERKVHARVRVLERERGAPQRVVGQRERARVGVRGVAAQDAVLDVCECGARGWPKRVWSERYGCEANGRIQLSLENKSSVNVILLGTTDAIETGIALIVTYA